MKFLIFASLLAAASASNPTFATDYAAESDVTEHGKIDKDMKDILADLAGAKATAKATYESGEYSSKSSGKRTLKGFSTGIGAKAIKPNTDTPKDGYYEQAYSLALAAGNADGFGDALVQALFAKSTTPSQAAFAVGINYGVTQLYTMHEFYDAVLDASKGTTQDNDASAKAWDEGVAFYTGSEQVKGKAGLNSMYGMAEMLSTDFGQTDSGDNTICDINKRFMEISKTGRDFIKTKTVDANNAAKALTAAEADELRGYAEELHGLMTAANIQWFIKSHKETGTTAADKEDVAKILGTLIHAELNACTKDGAATFKDKVITNYANLSDSWSDIMTILHENYSCMIRTSVKASGNTDYGATVHFHRGCSWVGAYKTGASNTQANCDDADIYPRESTKKTAGDGSGDQITVSKIVAGYDPASDVAQHALLDKDVRRMGVLAGNGDFVNAYRIYSQGWNSYKTNSADGTFKSWRNYKGFASESKLSKFQEGRDMNTYYSGYDGLDKFVTSALQATSPHSKDTDGTARKEMAIKGLQFGVNLYYVIREFYDAVDDCTAGQLTNNYGNVHAWDEGVMFWAGSLEGADGSGNGELLHMLAEKRSGQYDYTTSVHGKTASSVNADLLVQFKAGEAHLVDGKCLDANPIIKKVISLMIVPIIQGAQRYAWKVGSGSSNTPKSRAEGWAFASSILPMIHACRPASATTIVKNMDYNAEPPMADGAAAVFEAFQKTFSCLGVTCEDIGELNEKGGSDKTQTAPACKDDFSDTLDSPAPKVGAGLTGVAIGALLGAGGLML